MTLQDAESPGMASGMQFTWKQNAAEYAASAWFDRHWMYLGRTDHRSANIHMFCPQAQCLLRQRCSIFCSCSACRLLQLGRWPGSQRASITASPFGSPRLHHNRTGLCVECSLLHNRQRRAMLGGLCSFHSGVRAHRRRCPHHGGTPSALLTGTAPSHLPLAE